MNWPDPEGRGRAGRADRGVVDGVGAGLQSLPDDPQPDHGEAQLGHPLSLGRGETVRTGTVHVDLVGRDLVHQVHPVEQNGAPGPVHQERTARRPERSHRPVGRVGRRSVRRGCHRCRPATRSQCDAHQNHHPDGGPYTGGFGVSTPSHPAESVAWVPSLSVFSPVRPRLRGADVDLHLQARNIVLMAGVNNRRTALTATFQPQDGRVGNHSPARAGSQRKLETS